MKLKQRKLSRPLVVFTIILCVIGLVMMYSASAVKSFQRYGYNYYFITRQGIAVAVGLLAMLILSRIDYHIFKRYSPLIMLTALAVLALVLVPGLGVPVGRARRWFTIGSVSLQPVEFAKLALIFYLATWFEMRRLLLPSFFSGLLGALVVVGLTVGLVVIEPDFGSAIAVALISLSVAFAGGMRWRHLGLVAAGGAVAGWIAVLAAPHALERIKTFLNPALDPLGAGYQINQALLAIGSGGIWGFGLGKSRQKFNFLPEPIGDSIFAIMAEELGFLRILVLLALYALFAFWGLGIARRAPDTFGKLVAVGVTMWIVIQASVNIGAMVGLFPLTGIPLPFMSYGGSAVIAQLVGIGVVLNISRHRL